MRVNSMEKIPKQKRSNNYLALGITAVILALIVSNLLNFVLRIIGLVIKFVLTYWIWIVVIGFVVIVLYKKVFKKPQPIIINNTR